MMPLDPNASKTKAAPAAGPTAPSGGPEPSAPPPGLSAPPGMTAVWYALTRRWLTILVLGGGLGAVGAAAVWFAMPAKYTATATLHLDPHPPRGVYESNEDFASFRANQATQIKSDSVLEAALQKPETADLPEVRAQGQGRAGLAPRRRGRERQDRRPRGIAAERHRQPRRGRGGDGQPVGAGGRRTVHVRRGGPHQGAR